MENRQPMVSLGLGLEILARKLREGKAWRLQTTELGTTVEFYFHRGKGLVLHYPELEETFLIPIQASEVEAFFTVIDERGETVDLTKLFPIETGVPPTAVYINTPLSEEARRLLRKDLGLDDDKV